MALKRSNTRKNIVVARDAVEALRRIRISAVTKLLPVVIRTSSTKERDLLSGYRAGANSHIRKPVDSDKLMDAVRGLDLYWLALNEPAPAAAS